ncbi:dTMP kinase [Paractinoplanes brasiliensis]|uniref:Thymidylate kinase n=1 Tax=Paractinoplanes brasiliensis TaxID=52695 RepID=A0A4R6JB37_9ACTN|nr:hypothetical protein [Actinoplanes brasiliensis]TDO32732.1 thymidylate kinase [Actinoplanes brasiliensis]GID31726.1 hypothetical protein Abr02nite_67090 [Actinoplanes brasiliensis]
MILALEGLDGAGKTTVGRLLADMIGARYVPLPPPKTTLADTALFRELNSSARYLYYLTGVLAVAEEHHDPEIVLADRFAASAHALHLRVPGTLAQKLRGLPLPMPDVTFYLDVDESVRRARLAARGGALDPFEQLLDVDAVFRAEVAATMRSYRNTHVIDTTTRSPSQVARFGASLWRELQRASG